MSRVSLRGRRWRLPEPPAGEMALVDLSLPRWLKTLLARRGFSKLEDVQRYLEPSLGQLHDPGLIADMDRATQRLQRALEDGECITIYGDYDVDGVCATATLTEFLRNLGADVSYYIPDRREEGYGLNVAAVREIAKRARVLITVDCGITAFAPLEAAQAAGLDTIVVDHHKVAGSLPAALACLNPQREDCSFPFPSLCAAGLAFMLVIALRRRLRENGVFGGSEPDVRPLLDMVALATVADMVPITDVNRVLVAAGLRRMQRHARPGIGALMSVAGVDPQEVTARDLGFRLGPRINARGRISHAGEAVELMLCQDPIRARMLAASLDAANTERRQVEKDTTDAAMAQVETARLGDDPILVVEDPQWHPGVLGLTASRLVNTFHRPAIVIGEGGKGSARSYAGLDLHSTISQCEEHLERFGGHAAAAGLTLAAGRLERFRAAACEAVRVRLGEPPYVADLELDWEVGDDELDLEMVRELSLLEPFGQENPEPLLIARRMAVRSKRVVGGEHLKLRLGRHEHDAIGFGMGRALDELPEFVDVAFRIERNVFRGRETLQLRIDDLRPSD